MTTHTPEVEIYGDKHCVVIQSPHKDSYFYRVMSRNNICLAEYWSAADAMEYAEWFSKTRTDNCARDVLAETAAERDRLRAALQSCRLMMHAWKGARANLGLPDDHGELNSTIVEIDAALANTTPPAPDPLRDAAPKLLAALKEYWRLSLIIDSAVRHADPAHTEAVAALMKEARAAIAKAEGRP